MKNFSSFLFFCFLLLRVLLCFSCSPPAATYGVHTSQKKLNAIKVQVNATKVQVNAIKVQVNAIKVQVNAIKVQVNATKVQVNATKVQVNATKVQVKRLVCTPYSRSNR
ncbi:MAG: hypothetical protein V7K25_22845 [Nostoc sp.]|uniref:hypothetical protein n=1 Tax=Nostoc sp. TaxID=1180 RepID=UPI002FF8F563